MEIEAKPLVHLGSQETIKYISMKENRLEDYLKDCDGIINGWYSGNRFHAVAWDSEKQMVYDPDRNKPYRFNDMFAQPHIAIEGFAPILDSDDLEVNRRLFR